jgi:pyruvate/2-oxoglutarate dehydrogenase complex dihydrolipoamide dehydrogenase (E3) component
MTDIIADICIIGAGSAGLSVAAGAAQMGAKTVLIEGHRMGGDCLNTGCVPSKSLLAAAKVAHAMRSSDMFGIARHDPKFDFMAVNRHVRSVIDGIAPHDSVERFTGLGCHVIQAKAHFVDTTTVRAGQQTVRARRFVIATGSRPFIPPIPGVDTVSFLTNETIFENTTLPSHLIVIGAGPIGCEMALAHRRLGSEVTMIDRGPMLPKDDSDAVDVVRHLMLQEGIVIHERTTIVRAEKSPAGVAIVISVDGAEKTIVGSQVLIAAGRQANVSHLQLEKAGVRYSSNGIEVDARLRTSNKKIFAAGDVAGGLQFTHAASYHAGIIIRNALFRLPAKNAPAAFPWVTYTDPELAQVGLNEQNARQRYGDDAVKILRADFAQNDRAQADRHTDGFLKAVVARRGKILGATIVGPQAGELILPWVLAINKGLKIGDMAGIIAPYPTLSEISKRAAGSYFTPTLFSSRVRRIVRFLGAFG